MRPDRTSLVADLAALASALVTLLAFSMRDVAFLELLTTLSFAFDLALAGALLALGARSVRTGVLGAAAWTVRVIGLLPLVGGKLLAKQAYPHPDNSVFEVLSVSQVGAATAAAIPLMLSAGLLAVVAPRGGRRSNTPTGFGGPAACMGCAAAVCAALTLAWPGMSASWMACAAFAPAVAWCTHATWTRWAVAREPDGRTCPRCGYDRTGLPPAAACPECGSAEGDGPAVV